jgi:hypothetical protein
VSNADHKGLHEALKQAGLIAYGAVIRGDHVRSILGLEYPEVGTKKQFDEIALAEMAAVDYVRGVILNHGMYIAGINGDYRILLPSENARQIELYMKSADRKLARALKLSRNTPRESSGTNSQIEARLMLKRQGLRGRGADQA